jgi:hypothetical protein
MSQEDDRLSAVMIGRNEEEDWWEGRQRESIILPHTQNMEHLLEAIEKSLEDENWYSALVLSLIIPDICWKIDNNKSSSKRYPERFDLYVGAKYKWHLSGKDCYALRCSFLHEGSNSIETQNARENLDRFLFIHKGTHCLKMSNCYFGDPRVDWKDVLILSVLDLCQDIVDGARERDRVQPQKTHEMLEIHTDWLNVGSMCVS